MYLCMHVCMIFFVHMLKGGSRAEWQDKPLRVFAGERLVSGSTHPASRQGPPHRRRHQSLGTEGRPEIRYLAHIYLHIIQYTLLHLPTFICTVDHSGTKYRNIIMIMM